MGFFKSVAKGAKKAVKQATKAGALDPLGLFQGAEKRNQRFRKAGRIGLGMAGGAMKGGIYGAIAGGAVAGYGASKKGQGNVPLTLGRGLKDLGSGYLAGMGTNALASKGLLGAGVGAASKSAAANTVAVNAAPSTAGIGGVMSNSAPSLANAAPAASKWSNIISARDITTPLIAGQIQNTLGLNQPQPMPEQGQMSEQDRVNAIYNDYLMAQENRRKRMYTPV